ncbi:tetratricopeptide repeat protein [Novosphingobium sp. TH158]|uniref:tetratricopeptide repeat protein n=1 Tax=Novosphingobium sp. TH158 TaxID=2067455 RepID=UPI000C7AD79A|nr:tetratricopeptide repeat protein [Novosphingobium sp. TH158]PLK25544.1 hypothetical protein C0V78_00525 [Novosphingobium sp. TH158]
MKAVFAGLFLTTFMASTTAYAADAATDIAAIPSGEWLALPGDVLRKRLNLPQRCGEFDAAAQAGVARAQTVMSSAILNRVCGTYSVEVGEDLARKAHASGDLRALVLQGNILALKGDKAGAYRIYSSPRLAQVPIAMSAIATAAYWGEGRTVDRQLAREYWANAAALGDFSAMTQLAWMIMSDPIGKRDLNRAEQLFSRSARNGHLEGMASYGSVLVSGAFGESRKAEGIGLLRQAADLGNARGTSELGRVLIYGLGMAKDIPQGLALMKKGGDLGDRGALNELGIIYRDGVIVSRDRTLAVSYFQRAAKAGDPWAYRNLHHEYGRATASPEERAQAMIMLEKAVALGDREALNDMGVAYELGKLVPTSLGTAFDYYRRAAAQGSVSGHVNLARMYDFGIHVARNPAAAESEYKLAIAAGSPTAAKSLSDMRQRLASEAQAARALPATTQRSAGLSGPPNAYDIRAALMREWATAVLGPMAQVNYDQGFTSNGFWNTGMHSAYAVANPTCSAQGKGLYRCTYKLWVTNTVYVFGSPMKSPGKAGVTETATFNVQGGVWRSPSARSVALAHARQSAAMQRSTGDDERTRRENQKRFYCPGNGANPLDTQAFC